MQFQRAAVVKRRLRVSAKGLKKGTKARVTITGQSIRVTIPGKRSAQILRVRMSRGGLRASKRLRRRGRPKLTFRLTATQKGAPTAKARVRVRPAVSSAKR